MDPKVLVVGGGPAGSIAGALLARRGARVRLLERARFPRYHIGESVATSCRNIIELAGALEKVQARDYQVKEGLLLRWGAEQDWVVDWPEIFGTDAQTSWQVDRADFDEVLLRHAASQGVQVDEGAQARRVLFEDGRAVGAEWTHDGREHSERADFVIDASGRSGLLSVRHLKNRRPHDVFRNVAVWGYYRGGGLLPRTPGGGINVISSPEGWYWIIPLKDQVFSVGFVTHQDRFLLRKEQHPDLEELFLDAVQESETVRELTASGVYRPGVRVEQDFSYSADAFCGPGYFLAGDAACFLDPLLSTGVHLAMYSGMLAAASVLAVDEEQVSDAEARAFYESLYRNAYGRMFSMVAGFYEQYRGKSTYFWLAQQLARGRYPELVRRQKPRQEWRSAPDSEAFAAITSGAVDLDDAGRPGGTHPLRARVLSEELSGQKPLVNEYDAATGLHLVTAPRLGIGRAVDPARV